MKVKELFEKRLLRKIPPDKEKSVKSLEISLKHLNEAKEIKSLMYNDMIILACYTCMFHAARALLYKDGVQEKSHYAVYIYLKENYSKALGNLIFEFNAAREQRQEGLYGLEYRFKEEDYEHIFLISKRFYKKINELV
ncbi:MAG: HEPN domain-containing protein [Candidatus Nanoarchaeia archaeon]